MDTQRTPSCRGPAPLAVALLILGICANPASAQTFITGTVVDWMGNPVQGVDIDALDDDGDPADLTNDGTNASGAFLTQVDDGPGIYDFIFNPPGGADLVAEEVKDQFVVGTVDLGTIVLPLGYALSGTVVNPSLVPVQGASLTVLDSVNGDDVTPDKNKTDAAGTFSFQVEPGTYDVLINPGGVVFAPAQVLAVAVNAPTSIGTVVLENGFTLSGTIRSGGAGQQGVDIDVLVSATGVQLYTPGDTTNASGFVDVIVPAGTYDIEIEPNKNLRLVAQVLTGQVVAGNTSFGTVDLADGWQLSGKVTDSLANPLFDVDVDAFDPVSGNEIHLPGSHTDSAGNYLVVVPPGMSDVLYTPPLSAPQGGKALSLSVNADRVQNVSLDDCPLPVHYGSGNAGTGGFTPTIESVGDLPRAGVQNFQLQVANGIGGGRATLFVGLVPLNIQGNGWTFLVNPMIRLTVPLSGPNGVGGAGQFTLSTPLPPDPNLGGLHLYVQAWVPDLGAIGNIACSDGLDIEFCQ